MTANPARLTTVTRAPIRSNRMPTGTWIASNAQKKQALAKPSMAGDSARSRINSGPMTLVDARKHCDKPVVAISITTSASAARRRGSIC